VPGHTALVVIDDQRDFLHPDGWYAKSGIDVTHLRRVIEPTQQLVAACRDAQVPVIWTRHGTRGVDDGGPFMQLRPFLRDGGLRKGTWGYENHDDFEVAPDDCDLLVAANKSWATLTPAQRAVDPQSLLKDSFAVARARQVHLGLPARGRRRARARR